MNASTLVLLGLAVVWAIVLVPELLRKISGSRGGDSIRSFNQQLSVLDRSGARRPTGGDLRGSGKDLRSNVIDLRNRASQRAAAVRQAEPAPAPRPVSPAVRKRRQEVLAVLGAGSVLGLLCAVAFGGVFVLGFLLFAGLLVAYAVLLFQANQSAQPSAVRHAADRGSLAPVSSMPEGLRTSTVSSVRPAARRVAN